jgi:hypothetical protein
MSYYWGAYFSYHGTAPLFRKGKEKESEKTAHSRKSESILNTSKLGGPNPLGKGRP